MRLVIRSGSINPGILLVVPLILLLLIPGCEESEVSDAVYIGYWQYDHELDIRGGDTSRVSLVSQGIDSAFILISKDGHIRLERHIGGLVSVDSGNWSWAADTFRMDLVHAGLDQRFLWSGHDTLYQKEIKGLRSASNDIIDVYLRVP